MLSLGLPRARWFAAALLVLLAAACDTPTSISEAEDRTAGLDGNTFALDPLEDTGDPDGQARGGIDSPAHDRRRGAASAADTPLNCELELPYAREVVRFDPGPDAGFGQSKLPDVVLGPPAQGPPTSGSLDVLSLGLGGEIVLSFGGRRLLNGPGPDLIVWENPFWIGGDPAQPYAELGEVSVSEDGNTWHTFPCDPDNTDDYDRGCAGWRPRYEFHHCEAIPLQVSMVGGDTFDLAELGIESARFVRIRDLNARGVAPSAGFDLDAVGAVHLEP